MTRKFLLLLLCSLLLFVGGCWDILLIEDLALIQVIGFDEDPEDSELMAVTIACPALSEKATASMFKVTVKANSINQALINAQRQAGRNLVLGQTTVLVFSEQFARSGKMNEVVRQLALLRDMNANAMLAVVQDAPAQHVLQLENPVETRIGVFLPNLLERNQYRGLTPTPTATGYWNKHHTLGIDPVAPIIQITGHEDEKKGLVIAGLGVFNSAGKMTGILTDNEILPYQMLSGEGGRLRFTTEVKIRNERRTVAGYIENVKCKIKSEIKNNKPRIDISLIIFVDGVDIEWDANVLDPKAIDKLGQLLAQDFQGNIQEMLEKTQNWQADCIGLGRRVRVQHPKWFKGKDWAEEYKKCEISVTAEVTVRRIGTLVEPQN